MPKPRTKPFDLDAYRQLADLSTQIIQHVHNERWLPAAALCRAYHRALCKIQHNVALSPSQQKARRALLNTILANDAEIRSLMHPESQFIHLALQSQPSQKLEHSYYN